MAVAITLTPGSSPGQALTLSHQGRGDIEVSPEDVFGVGRVEISNPVTSKSSWHRDNPTIRRTKDYDQDGFDLSIPVPVRHLMMVSHVGRIEIDCNGSKLNHGFRIGDIAARITLGASLSGLVAQLVRALL